MKLIDRLLGSIVDAEEIENENDGKAESAENQPIASESEPSKHYWRATIMCHGQGKEPKYARWLEETTEPYFPMMDVERKYFCKYKTRPIILFWGEISKKDFDEGNRFYRVSKEFKPLEFEV